MPKVDVHNLEGRYKNWKARALQHGEENLIKKNSDVLLKYVFDMEVGVNISNRSKKGARSYSRLYNIKNRLSQIIRWLEERGVKDITKIKEKEVMDLFNDMRKGTIKNSKGEIYKSTADYAEVFRSFWHWWMKVNKKESKVILDITEDLDTTKEDSKFVNITKEELEKMLPYFSQDEQVVLLFVFDSLIRAPTEILSLQVKDVFQRDGIIWVNIRKEISKTIGRTLNFLYCGDALIDYIKRNKLQPNDFLFNFSYSVFTEKLQTVAKQIFDNKISEAGEFYKKITLYDLRHSGAIHLRLLAQKTKKISVDALRQRGGWTDFDMLNEYTRFLGLTGEIDSNDLLIEADKSKLEKEIDDLKKVNVVQQDNIIKLTSEVEKLWAIGGRIRYVKVLLEAANKNEVIKQELRKYIKKAGGA